MSCICHALASVHLLPCGHLRADLLALVCDVYCDFVTFSYDILGQVWYLIVSIPDPCCLSYFEKNQQMTKRHEQFPRGTKS